MIKSCREIAEDINDLKRKLQQDRMIKRSSDYFADRRKCDSNNASDICSYCICWKSQKSTE